MDFSHVSAISVKPCLPSNFRHSTTPNSSNLCYNMLRHCSLSSWKHLNSIPAAAMKVEAKMRYFGPQEKRREQGRLGMRYSPIRRAPLLSSMRPCKATSDDSGRLVSGDSILLNEETLERELQIAIDQENYAEAARIRDRIRVLHEDSEAAILAANARFYNAFRTGDLSSMETLWAKQDDVCCVHPGAGGISGYEFVVRSWEYVWMDYDFPLDIQLKDVRVHVTGDVGYVTCMELVKTKGNSWGKQFATNVFEKIDGQWLICIHHASPVDL